MVYKVLIKYTISKDCNNESRTEKWLKNVEDKHLPHFMDNPIWGIASFNFTKIIDLSGRTVQKYYNGDSYFHLELIFGNVEGYKAFKEKHLYGGYGIDPGDEVYHREMFFYELEDLTKEMIKTLSKEKV